MSDEQQTPEVEVPSAEAEAPAAEAEPKAEAAPEAPSEPRKYRVKVDGQELEVPEDELLKGYELKQASYNRMKQAAEERRKAEVLFSAFQDPSQMGNVAQALGLDAQSRRALAQALVQEELRTAGMTDEERRQYEFERERSRFEEEKQRFQRDQEERELASRAAAIQDDLAPKMVAAMDSAGLPRSEHAFNRMLEIAMNALDEGIAYEPEELAAQVREEYDREVRGLGSKAITYAGEGALKEYFSGLSAEQVISLLGPDVMKAVREHELSQLRGAGQAKQSEPEPVKAAPKKAMLLDDYFRD